MTAGADTRLHLYVRPPRSTFQLALRVPGHEGWVRSLALAHVGVPGSVQSELLLASASQDRWGDICKWIMLTVMLKKSYTVVVVGFGLDMVFGKTGFQCKICHFGPPAFSNLQSRGHCCVL